MDVVLGTTVVVVVVDTDPAVVVLVERIVEPVTLNGEFVASGDNSLVPTVVVVPTTVVAELSVVALAAGGAVVEVVEVEVDDVDVVVGSATHTAYNAKPPAGIVTD